MDSLNKYWGVNDDITVEEIVLRAIVMFALALVMVRFSGMRPFGKGNPYDIIIAFLLGGILSRGVVGGTPFFSSVAGGVAIIVLHKIIGRISVHFKAFDKVINGQKVMLYQHGRLLHHNMKKVNVTDSNIHEELRRQLHLDNLNDVSEVYMEKTGEISFIRNAP